MSGTTRQKVLLAVLVVALGWALFGGGGDADDGGPGLVGRGAPSDAASQAQLVTDVVALEIERLVPAGGVFTIGRDPFRYGEDPTPPPRPQPPPVVKPPAPNPPPEPKPPPGPQPPSTGHLSYLGSFGPAARPIAVVVSGEEIYNVREGDVVEGDFVVRTIGLESIDIGFVEFPDVPPDRLASGG